MAKNEVYRVGQYVPAPIAPGTPAGTPVRLGELNGIAVQGKPADVAATRGSALDLGGAWVVPVTVSGGATTFGQPIYIDSNGALVTVATNNKLFGAALEWGVANGNNVPLTVKVLN